MGIYFPIFWFLIIIVSLFIYRFITSLQIPLFDDTVSIYSVFKDIIGLSVAIIGLKLAIDWKKQTIFTQKNKKAIEISSSLNRLQRIFNHEFLTTLLHLRIIAETLNRLHNEHTNTKPNTLIYNDIHNRLRSPIVKVIGRMKRFNESLNDFIEISNVSFIFREDEFQDITNEILNILSGYLSFYSILSIYDIDESRPAFFSRKINQLLGYFDSDQIDLLFSDTARDHLKVTINTLLSKQKAILEKYC